MTLDDTAPLGGLDVKRAGGHYRLGLPIRRRNCQNLQFCRVRAFISESSLHAMDSVLLMERVTAARSEPTIRLCSHSALELLAAPEKDVNP